jgi:hypothetical protein
MPRNRRTGIKYDLDPGGTHMTERVSKRDRTRILRTQNIIAILVVVMAAGVVTLSCTKNPTGRGETISAPNKPTGPTTGTVGVSLTFTIGGAVSSEAGPIQYQMDYGEGTPWPAWYSQYTTTVSHIWTAAGAYHVKSRARSAAHQAVISPWSDSLLVTISAAVK